MAQQEYFLGYALTFAMVFLGFLVVCIPRPRKSKFLTAEEEKREKQKKKMRKSKKRKKK